jgi:hypothetical protein
LPWTTKCTVTHQRSHTELNLNEIAADLFFRKPVDELDPDICLFQLQCTFSAVYFGCNLVIFFVSPGFHGEVPDEQTCEDPAACKATLETSAEECTASVIPTSECTTSVTPAEEVSFLITQPHNIIEVSI